jgi:hypothetical protein
MQTVITKEIPSGSTRINCPSCGHLDVPAQIIERQETLMESLVIPMGTQTTWWVACSACQVKLYSKLSAAKIQGKTPAELVGQIYVYTSFVNQFMAVAALLLSIFPGLGTILAAIAWVMNRKLTGWPRKLSKIAFFASFLWIPGLFILAMLDSWSRHHH